MTPQDTNFTWQALTKIEPRLNDLLRDIRAIKDDPAKKAFCANRHWYLGDETHAPFKDRMCRLAGFEAQNRHLRTMQVYDLAYTKLYAAYPTAETACVCEG